MRPSRRAKRGNEQGVTVSYDYAGRCVLVTGGTRGIGAGIAAAFRAVGADVVICARNAKIIELNLTAPLHLAQRAYQVMRGQDGGGAIVMIGSVSGARPSPGTAAYGAAKAGLHHLAACLAAEWAPKVRVNSVIVGLADTGGADEHYGGAETLADVAATIPAGRLAVPADVAQACLFLGAPEAAYINGASLRLHGGGEQLAWTRIVRNQRL
jgi:NAD(P)-dependent dehydrogenase (short-subunit alcohol dehydrogenase family)